MKRLANKSTLVTLISLMILSVSSLPIQAQFGGGGLVPASGLHIEELGLKLEQEFAKLVKKVQQLDKKVELVGRFMLDLKKSPLADMQNSQVSVFRLKYLAANSAAVTISALLGEEGFRMAIEEKSNQLIVSAPAEISERIGELLQKIDVAPVQENESIATSQKQTAPRTLQVHTFWLAAGMLDGSTHGHLPVSVFRALDKIGVTGPGIIAQSTTSLIAKDVSLSESSMHATFKNQEFLLTNKIELSLNKEKQIELHVQTQILKGSEKQKVCELRGSLTAPLGHYMVLGTTNYVAKNSEQHKTLNSSRFAFVLQVVEASSFAPKRISINTREPVVKPSEAVQSSKNTKEHEIDPFADERGSKSTKEPEADPFR